MWILGKIKMENIIKMILSQIQQDGSLAPDYEKIIIMIDNTMSLYPTNERRRYKTRW